ncbi:hypothetical protein QO017_000213 [Methylobacterium gregans]|nr:hypothetical protein [Methylobacterium gregans]
MLAVVGEPMCEAGPEALLVASNVFLHGANKG